MSKKEKLKQRLLSRPKDFNWAELTSLLLSLGYTLHKGSGSRRKFISPEKDMINLHEPHPDKTIKVYILDQVIHKLGWGNENE